MIALWFGHAGVGSTDTYLHTDININEEARALLRPRRCDPAATDRPTRSPRRRFPASKALDGFQVAVSSAPQPTFDHLASLDWIGGKEHVCLISPAGTDKAHLLLGLGHAAVQAGREVRYLSAAALYRGLADNSVGRGIETLLRHDLVTVELCRGSDCAEHRGGGRGGAAAAVSGSAKLQAPDEGEEPQRQVAWSRAAISASIRVRRTSSGVHRWTLAAFGTSGASGGRCRA